MKSGLLTKLDDYNDVYFFVLQEEGGRLDYYDVSVFREAARHGNKRQNLGTPLGTLFLQGSDLGIEEESADTGMIGINGVNCHGYRHKWKIICKPHDFEEWNAVSRALAHRRTPRSP
jgi:hypothetical protein